MPYKLIQYDYDEPAFKGCITAALCDSMRDIMDAAEDYYALKKPHYLLLTPNLKTEYEGWAMGFENIIDKRRVQSLENLLLGVSIIGIPFLYIKKYQTIKDLEAKSMEKPGFFYCYISNCYEYKDGYYGVNLAKASKAGDLLMRTGKLY